MVAPLRNINAKGTNHTAPEWEALDAKRIIWNGETYALRIRNAVRGIRKNAKRRNFSWDVPDLDIAKMLLQECYYCGKAPQIDNDDYNPYNGIDRVNSDFGYEPGNVQTCCRRCNVAKGNMSHSQFISLIRMIHNYHSEII
jgi:hypothetical protein